MTILILCYEEEVVDYEKMSFFSNYVEIQHEQYEKVMLAKLLIENFILHHWNDWMDIIIKAGNFNVLCLHRSFVLKIDHYTHEDIHNKQNSKTNFFLSSGNDT